MLENKKLQTMDLAIFFLCTSAIHQGWEAWPHTHLNEKLNPSTSAKPVMVKLQNLFVALVNIDTFQIILKLSLFTVDF